MTPIAAAKKLAADIVKQFNVSEGEVLVWDRAACQKFGFNADAAVVWEGGPFEWAVDWQLGEKYMFKNSQMQPYKGVFCEPYNSFIMGFYKE